MQSSFGCFEEWQLPVISCQLYSSMAVARLAAAMRFVMFAVMVISKHSLIAAVYQVIAAMATVAMMSLAMEMPGPTL